VLFFFGIGLIPMVNDGRIELGNICHGFCALPLLSHLNILFEELVLSLVGILPSRFLPGGGL
jgi:hypothetical protein